MSNIRLLQKLIVGGMKSWQDQMKQNVKCLPTVKQ